MSVAHGWLYFIYPFPNRPRLTLMRIFPRRLWGLGRVAESPFRMSPTSSLSPKMSRRYRAIFFCWWMLQWFSMDRTTGYLQDKYLKKKKCSDFNKLKNIVQKNLAQDWSSLTMTFAVEPILPVRLPMLLKIIFLYSLFSCLQKIWDNQTKTKHMLESCWLMRKCWQFCRFYNLGIRNCSHDKSQE